MDSLLKKMGMNQTRHELKSRNSPIMKKSALKEDGPLNNKIQTRMSPKTSEFLIQSLKEIQNINEQKIPANIKQYQSEIQILEIEVEKEKTIQIDQISKRSDKIPSKQINISKKIEKPKKETTTPLTTTQITEKQNSHHCTNETQKLQQIVAYLGQKLTSKCLLPNHQQNKILFICFQPECSNRIGCSYCFLSTHQNHLKCQISTCIQDLQETIFKVNANYELFSKKIQSFCEDFYSKLDTEIENIRKQFETNLSFLRKKAAEEFESKFRSKYLEFLNSQYEMGSIVGKMTKNVQTLKNSNGYSSAQSKLSKSKIKDEKKQKQILSNYENFKIEEIYVYLRKRLQIFHFETVQTTSLLQFFKQINSSMQEIFRAFKFNIPKIIIKESLNEKPKILERSKFNLD